MLNAITTAITGPKTVDGIMSTFTKAINDLESVRTASNAEATRLEEEAAAAVSRANAATREANRAAGMIGRLQALVGG